MEAVLAPMSAKTPSVQLQNFGPRTLFGRSNKVQPLGIVQEEGLGQPSEDEGSTTEANPSQSAHGAMVKVRSWATTRGKFAAKVMRRKKKKLQFNRQVRDVELEYYLKHLHQHRKLMLGL